MGKIARRGFLGLLGLGMLAPAAALKKEAAQATQRREDALCQKPMRERGLNRSQQQREEAVWGGSLKPDRYSEVTDISYFCDVSTQRGTIVEVVPEEAHGEGIVRPGQHGGVPIGLLLTDVVEIDLRKSHLAFHRAEAMVGGKVEVMVRGTAVVGPCEGSPEIGDPIYYNEEGLMTTEKVSKRVGTCLSRTCADGFLKVEINPCH